MSAQPHPVPANTGNRSTSSVFWKLMYQVAVVAGATHVLFLALFLGLGARNLALVNVGSIALFALSFWLLKRRLNMPAILLIVSEILGHAVLAVRAIGWDSGFHYYLLVMVPVIVISRMSIKGLKPFLIACVLLIYVSMDYTMRDLTPLDTVHPQTLSALRYFNVAVTFLLQTYLAHLYLNLVSRAERDLRQLATTDPLTQLLNRRSLLERAEYEMLQRKRNHSPLAFILADIDHFKAINDQYGHAAGDAVLTAVSQVLRQALREQDSVARWGGEEFLILMPNASLEMASNIAERLRKQVADIEVPFDTHTLRVSMTFGVSTHRDEESIDEPVSRADSALYKGKMTGRNQVVAEIG